MTDDTEPTTLHEFADGEDVQASSDGADVDEATAEQNAEDIQYLIDCVQSLTEKVSTIAGEIEHQDVSGGDYTPTDEDEDETTERMFQ